MKKSAILFKLYYNNTSALKELKRIDKSINSSYFDLYISYDNTRLDIGKLKLPNNIKLHLFDKNKISNKYPETYLNNKASLWANTEHSTIDFFKEHPDYYYYWVVDHDVRFTGNWNDFFSNFINNDADLLATYVEKYGERNWHVDVYEDWWCWKTGNLNIKDSNKARAFFAIYRFSNEALEFLDKNYISGTYGFCEMTVPTLLNHGGFKIKDIRSFYNRDTFNYFNRRTHPGRQANMLYHPILPFSRILYRKYKNIEKKFLYGLKNSKYSYYFIRLIDKVQK